MPSLDSIIAITLAGFALAITPGPSMFYVLSRSIGQSRAAGLASAVGLALGGVLLAIATALGLAIVFARFEWLATGLRYAGVAYLLYLGVTAIKDVLVAAKTPAVDKVKHQPLTTIMWQGVLVEFLNPKTVLFLALFVPPFVTLDAMGTNVTLQLLVLGMLVPLTAIPSDLVVSFLGGSVADAIKRNPKYRVILGVISGLVLIAIAINLAIQVI